MEIQKEMDAAEETISSLTSDKERLSQEVLQAQKEMLALVEQAKVGDLAKSQLTSVEEALKTSNEQLLEATVSLTTHRFTAPNFSILVPVLLLSSPRTRFRNRYLCRNLQRPRSRFLFHHLFQVLNRESR